MLTAPRKRYRSQGGFGQSLYMHVGWGWKDRLAYGHLEEESGGERSE